MSNTFLYFAYGSNLLTKRIHLSNPTAIKKNIGFIKNFRLDFNYYSRRWRGASATIVPTKDYTVWGVVWELDICNLETLDGQEGVADKIYFPFYVDVQIPEGSILNCRVYQQCNIPTEFIKLKQLPQERKPSPFYLDTMISGAQENDLPLEYIKFLNLIPNNSYDGEYDVNLIL
ncbi:gamma-glutamylcyclotransferase-like isoform X2 [Prorops nasuta]|uniref:gamma-glutamylcyclotransferase-like isoform X2 n=1 Tax=Prorops nasuta TaxID=863751 RepID=UPI0034D01BBE